MPDWQPDDEGDGEDGPPWDFAAAYDFLGDEEDDEDDG